ncbi:MAG: hypothetical protein WAT39_26360 [Planctomycetota bacterium]
MTDTRCMSERDQEGKGRRIVLIIIIATLSMSAAVTATYLLVRGSDRLSQQWVRFVLTVILSLNLYWGAAWARWIASVLFLIGGVLGLVSLFGLRQMDFAALLLTALCLTYLGSAVALIALPSVRAHFGVRARPSAGSRQHPSASRR